MKRKVFFSFHYKKDVFRVQQVRNIGAIEDDQIVTANKWEEIKQKGSNAIKDWININLKGKSCLIVLIGEETAKSKWVDYEIRQAWDSNKAVFGIYIHNLKDIQGSTSTKGLNPFDNILLKNGEKLSKHVVCYNPPLTNAYKYIAENLENWIETAIASR